MGHTLKDVVRVLNVMPVAWGSGDLLLDLDGHRRLNHHLLHGGALLDNLDIFLSRHVNLDRYDYSHGHLVVPEDLDLLGHVNEAVFHDFGGHVALDLLVDDFGGHVLLLDLFDFGHSDGDFVDVLFGLGDVDGDFDDGGVLDRNGFNVGLGYFDLLSDRNDFVLHGGDDDLVGAGADWRAAATAFLTLAGAVGLEAVAVLLSLGDHLINLPGGKRECVLLLIERQGI